MSKVRFVADGNVYISHKKAKSQNSGSIVLLCHSFDNHLMSLLPFFTWKMRIISPSFEFLIYLYEKGPQMQNYYA